MRKCNHELAERETACADGLCPICLQQQLAAEREALRWEKQEHAKAWDKLDAAVEALKLAADLGLDVRQQHADPNDNFYNDCDHNECQWCSESRKIDAALAKIGK